MQYLQNLKREKLVHIATKCNLVTRQQQNIPDIIKSILRLHPDSQFEGEHFKNFPSVAELTGGILCLLCTHGFIYYSKVIMGGEGPSDIADAVRLFAPKVVVYDYANGLVSYMRSVDPTFFHNGHGFPGPFDPESVRKIKDSALKCIDKQRLWPKLADWADLIQKDGAFAVIDPFHAKNPKRETDRFLRNIKGIHGIPFKPNSVVQEQIWNETSKQKRSLNQMDYANHIAQWNFVVLHHNERLYNRLADHKKRQLSDSQLSPNKRWAAIRASQ